MKKVLIIVVALVATSLTAWEYTTNEDLMAGTTERLMMLEATAHQGTLRAPVLVVRQSDRLEVFIYWGGYNVDRDLRNVMIRIGEGDAFGQRVSLSQSREATFIPEPLDFLHKLDGRVVMLVSSATGRDMVGLWQIDDMAAALHRLTDGE